MTRNLYIIIAVTLRIISVCLIFQGIFSVIFMYLLGPKMAAGGTLLIGSSMLPAVGGILLWFLARPLALIVTSNLE